MSYLPKYEIQLSKMHGAGNDFIVFETRNVKRLTYSPDTNNGEDNITLDELKEITLKLSHRKLGVGFDQAIIINNNPKVIKEAHYEMIVINSDGEQASMCGNGVRCFSKYIIDNNVESLNGSIGGTPIKDRTTGLIEQKIETLAGLVICYPLLSHTHNQFNVTMVKVNMNNAMLLETNKFSNGHFPSPTLNKQLSDPSSYLYTIDNLHVANTNITKLQCVLVSMGNPHCVIFIETNIALGYLSNEYAGNLSTMNINDIAVALQSSPIFKNGCNVEFVSIANSESTNRVISRVYERGAGETLACGTGACGVAVASILMSHCQPEKEVTVSMPGGDLLIQWSNNDKVYKTGPACTVFDSKIKL